jgi:hypothetical protein
MSDGAHIQYFGMGPWPIYVGFTMSPKAFRKEMKRLNVRPRPDFTSNSQSHATMHSFTAPSGGLTMIIAMEKPAKRSAEQIAGLIAHEAVHIAQRLWANIGEDRPGWEAEAYLVQMITQCCMEQALKTGRERKTVP